MKNVLLVLALLSFAQPAPGATASPRELLLPLDRFIAAFNRWHASLPTSAFTNDRVVLDIFRPFEWKGSGALERWWRDLAGSDRLAHPAAFHEHLEQDVLEALTLAGDRTSFNVATTLTYVRNNVRHQLQGRWIISEKRTAPGWRISAQAWATVATDPCDAQGACRAELTLAFQTTSHWETG